jgi:hypothetical protein
MSLGSEVLRLAARAQAMLLRPHTAAPASAVASQWGIVCTASDNNPNDGIVTTADPKCDVVKGQSGSPVWDPRTTMVMGVLSHENVYTDKRVPGSIGITQVRLGAARK